MQTARLLALRLFEIVMHKEEYHYQFHFIDSKKATRASLCTVTESEMLFARYGGHVLAGLSDRVLGNSSLVIAEAIKLFGVGKDCRIIHDGTKRKGKLGADWNMDSVTEGKWDFSTSLWNNWEDFSNIMAIYVKVK